MEQELSKERKPASRLKLERFRCFVYFVATACMISCIVVLFVSLVSVQRRMAVVENTLSEIAEELKQLRSKNEAKESPSAGHIRRGRNANPTTVTLDDLTKRIIALESRSSFRGKWTFIQFLFPCFVILFSDMLLYQTSPVGVQLFSYVNTFFCSNKFAWLLDT